MVDDSWITEGHGGALHSPPLLRIYRRLGPAELVGRPRLDFDEGEFAPIPHHEVDFAAPGERTIVARHYGAAAGAQEAVRKVFADATVILRIAAAAYAIGGAVEQADHFSTSNSNSMTLPRTT